MSGFGQLLAMQARRDRWLLPIWIVGIGVLGLAVAVAISGQFGDEADRASIIALASSNPAFLFLRGLPDGLSIGAVAFFQGFSFTGVLAGLMSTFLVVRHTRSDEERGRAELIGSTPIYRTTALATAIVLGVVANALLAVAIAAGYIVGGLPASGSILAALAAGSVGLFFVGATAVIAQVLPSGRASNGVAAALSAPPMSSAALAMPSAPPTHSSPTSHQADSRGSHPSAGARQPGRFPTPPSHR